MALLVRLRSRSPLLGGRFFHAAERQTRPMTCESTLKPFDQIPATVTESTESYIFHWYHRHTKVAKLGKIYQEKSPSSNMRPIVVAFDPDDVQTIFRADGKFPERLDLLGLKDINDILGVSGTVQTCQGEAWWHHRKPMSQFMMKPKKVAEYYEGFNSVTHDLLKTVQQLRDPETSMLSDVPTHFRKWSFESVALFILGKRMGALDVTRDPPEFLQALNNAFHGYQPHVQAILTAFGKLYSVGMNMFRKKKKEVDALKKDLKSGKGEVPEKMDFITSMLLSGNMNDKDLLVDTVDLLFAGTDTTAFTLSWTLYNLATHPEVQEKLRSEVLRVVGKEEKMVTPTHINKMPYLRNCIKETLRLYPTGPQITLRLHKDVALSGYFVPKGTIVIVPHYLLGRDSEIFPERTLEYFPKRWDRREGSEKPFTFSHVPFGFGTRMCVGRRVAELELYIALTHMMKNFRVEYSGDNPLGYTIKHTVLPVPRMDLILVDY